MNPETDEIIRTEEDEERRGKRLRTVPKPPEREGRTARPPERGTQRRNFGPHSPGPGNG